MGLECQEWRYHKERQLHFNLYRLIGGAVVAVLEEDVTLYNLGLPFLVSLRRV